MNETVETFCTILSFGQRKPRPKEVKLPKSNREFVKKLRLEPGSLAPDRSEFQLHRGIMGIKERWVPLLLMRLKAFYIFCVHSPFLWAHLPNINGIFFMWKKKVL